MIKNIVFDIGNVLVKWQPDVAVSRVFPTENKDQLTRLLFKSQPWYDLNLGKITEKELIEIHHENLGIEITKLQELMSIVKDLFIPVEKSFELLFFLHQSHYALYALTDNVREIMAYLRLKYNFWDFFKGVICSADVGFLKPMPEIYQKLFDTYALNPAESIFIDDHLPNVEGAKSVGMSAIQFVNTKQCITDLSKMLNYPIPEKF